MSQGVVSEQTFFVLAALVDKPRHGYAILGEVTRLSEGRVTLRVGTLYGVLDRLVRDGLVERDREEVHQGRLRRYYGLTQTGRDVLASEVDRQAANARTVRRLLAGRPVRRMA